MVGLCNSVSLVTFQRSRTPVLYVQRAELMTKLSDQDFELHSTYFCTQPSKEVREKLHTLPLLLMESPGRDSCHPKADTYSSAINCILQAPAFPPPVIKTNPPCLHAHNKATLIFIEYQRLSYQKKNQNGKLFKHIEQNEDALTSTFINQSKENCPVPDHLVRHSNTSIFQT